MNPRLILCQSKFINFLFCPCLYEKLHERRLVRHVLREIVGDAAAAVGDEAVLVDHDDLGIGPEAPEAAGDFRTEGDGSDYDHPERHENDLP